MAYNKRVRDALSVSEAEDDEMAEKLEERILDFVDSNDGVLGWSEACRLVSHLLQCSESTAEYHLGRMLAAGQIVVRRGKVETRG